jgi:hypothetical protein
MSTPECFFLGMAIGAFTAAVVVIYAVAVCAPGLEGR